MGKQRKQYSAQKKFRVSLAAAKDEMTIGEIASKYEVAPTQVSNWKQQLLKTGASLFQGKATSEKKETDKIEKELYEQIGRLKMEIEWLKKNLPSSAKAKRGCIDVSHSKLSIRRQCELLGLSRSGYYYQPAKEIQSQADGTTG